MNQAQRIMLGVEVDDSVTTGIPYQCDCGSEHVYSDPQVENIVNGFVSELGPTIGVTLRGVRYAVPRPYIAFHGLSAAALPALASLYHWRKRRVRGPA